MLLELKKKGFLMSIPDRVLNDLAIYKTLIAEVPDGEDNKRCFAVVHHIQDSEQDLLFDLKRFSIEADQFSALPEAENIEIEGMEHFVVDDLICLEMLIRLWVPNIEDLVKPADYELTSLHKPEPEAAVAPEPAPAPKQTIRRPNIRIRTRPKATV